ncbi:hypothetical protein TrCOL_g2192 [Triparma columacea]|uniref:Uncharacterized protein n=1 Tax=Triparma columacea TaxID=722753 RepID=A0A9W7L3H3_9STRA|nr:hypothetical protein TrCOL_g2192 [Triparma columacea]
MTVLPRNDVEEGSAVNHVSPQEVQVQSATGATPTTPMTTPPNRWSNAMKFLSPLHASLPLIIAVAAFCVHSDYWRIFNIIVLVIFFIFYVLSSNTLVAGAWVSRDMWTDAELATRLKTMRESRMEVQIHVQCSHLEIVKFSYMANVSDEDGGSHQEQRWETRSTKVVTHQDTIDFEYGACVDRSPHSVAYEGFSMCGLVFNGIYEWGDPDIAERYKLAVQKAQDDNAERDKEVSVVSTFKIPPMSPCYIKRGSSGSWISDLNLWMLAFLTGIVAYYDCWIGSTAGVADVDIRKVLCSLETLSSNNLDNGTSSSHRIAVAKPMAEYVGDNTLRYRIPFTNPSQDYVGSRMHLSRARNPCMIEEDRKMSFSSISNGRDLEVGQQVVVSFDNLSEIYKVIKYLPQLRRNYNGETSSTSTSEEPKSVLGKITNVIPGDTTKGTMYNVELYADKDPGNPNPGDVENVTPDETFEGGRVRAWNYSAVVTHVGGGNALSDKKIKCGNCGEIRKMEGFEFCGGCGKM